jgi:hypothetical protein
MWFTTHGYLTTNNNLVTRGTGNNATNQYGPDNAGYTLGAAPASLSGDEMWGGASGWSGLTALARNSLVTCGHWIDGYTNSGWVWQKKTTANDAARDVHQIFCNGQEGDYECSLTPTSDIAHLMLLRIWPTTVEAFMVSTHSGLWTGAKPTRDSETPVQLFSVPFTPVAINQLGTGTSGKTGVGGKTAIQ